MVPSSYKGTAEKEEHRNRHPLLAGKQAVSFNGGAPITKSGDPETRRSSYDNQEKSYSIARLDVHSAIFDDVLCTRVLFFRTVPVREERESCDGGE